MTFVSGMVAAVPASRKADYIASAERCWPLFRRAGALGMAENWGVDIPEGELTSFSSAVKKEPGEAVVFSWITWPDKKTADACWREMESDPDWAEILAAGMPFDARRMIFGGFQTILQY
ncbi:DUF1428 domain-containing protein [Poseidonocella sp. HB161398]|uniref:DUF1428 domain-containing protein n=1 Tax=Poseidonocella sp. HB161398 TaxID=2320855 RepID=UPI0011085B96|nr:DUF1428 domain-containing protein [Poseidonocella sp. HB161398]